MKKRRILLLLLVAAVVVAGCFYQYILPVNHFDRIFPYAEQTVSVTLYNRFAEEYVTEDSAEITAGFQKLSGSSYRKKIFSNNLRADNWHVAATLADGRTVSLLLRDNLLIVSDENNHPTEYAPFWKIDIDEIFRSFGCDNSRVMK